MYLISILLFIVIELYEEQTILIFDIFKNMYHIKKKKIKLKEV